MHIQSSVGLAVGPADTNHWGQVLIQPMGYGVVEIESNDGKAAEIGVHLLSRLGEALANEIKNLQALEKIVDTHMSPVVTSLIIFVPVGNVVYMVVRGKGMVYLKRKNQIAILMQEKGALSGEVREGDTMIIASNGFSRLLSKQEIASFFDHETPAVVAEKLTLALHEKKEGEGSVALVYQIGTLNEQKEIPKPQTDVHRSVRFPTHLVAFFKNPKKILAIVLCALFIFSVILGVIKQSAFNLTRDEALAYERASHAFEEGTALLDLNPSKGRERLTEAKKALDTVMSSVNTRSLQGKKVKDLYEKIQDNLTQSMQITVASPVLFYDMNLMKKDAEASIFALEGKTLAIADIKNSTVYRLDIVAKNAAIIGGGAPVSGLTGIALHGDKIYALTSSGIIEYKTTDKKSTLVIKRDDEWGSIGSMVAFGGNIYLLDILKSRIWKYVSVDNAQALNAESISATPSATLSEKAGFSSLREYLNPDAFPNFSQASNMTIDGTIWVGSRAGRVSHFVQGREESFVPNGVEPVLGSDTQVFATDETVYAYVLDRQNNRVVVLDKEGMYVAQYQWKDELNVNGFAVSETYKKILLLAGGKIYSIDLK